MDSLQPIRLSNKTLPQVNATQVTLPAIDYLKLPVKVLQFGTGILLRGLIDHVIDKANRRGIFNGRIAIVKSTDNGTTDDFVAQDNLYTLQFKGIRNKELIDEAVISSAISHVLSSANEWDRILQEVESPDLKIIISNTTEVGLQFVEEGIDGQPPLSFPAKLLAVLYHRYQTFKDSPESGFIIIPTELLPDNATVLHSILTKLIAFNQLEPGFKQWVNEHNYFCNSLVDRIVTGRPSVTDRKLFEEMAGYQDELMIVAEPYGLWAIEGDDSVKSLLSFEQADDGVMVMPDIKAHRELKLRLLNGTHTLSCALAILIGFKDVSTAANDAGFSVFLQSLMAEIRSAIPYQMDPRLADDFAECVLDRFRNPYLQHQWIAIAQQYTTKIRTRVLPVLKEYYRLYNEAPINIAKGFAAYLRFLSTLKKQDDTYYSNYKNVKRPFKDDKADLLMDIWSDHPANRMAVAILRNADLWEEDLTLLPGFAEAVQHYYNKLNNGSSIIFEDE